MINELVPLDKLDVEPEVKQLFKDVFRKDPASRPTALELLNRPVIKTAAEYERYFDECYDSEDAEESSSAPATAEFSTMDDHPHEVSHTSTNSCHSVGDEVGSLPQFTEGQNLNRCRGSQDSGVATDLENSVNGSMFGAQLSMRSSSSGSAAQQRFVHQDSGTLEDMNASECPQPDRPGE